MKEETNTYIGWFNLKNNLETQEYQVLARSGFKPSHVTPKPVPLLQCGIASHRFPESQNPEAGTQSGHGLFLNEETKPIDSPAASQLGRNRPGQESRSLNFNPV